MAERLASLDVPIVFDPVMVATSGAVLADEATIAAFERADDAWRRWSTPNLPELEVLTMQRIETLGELEDAACRQARSPTGKRGAGQGRAFRWRTGSPTCWRRARTAPSRRWESERIDTRHTHGTGCTLASAVASGLAAGLSLTDSISRARDFVRRAILAAPGFGAGHGPMGHALGVVPFDDIHRKI